MKTVFSTNSEACHKWASQSQPSGRANSISFDGPSIYSYAAEIGRFIDSETVFITTSSYSVTTSQHKSCALSAISHCSIYEVPSFTDHKENLAYFVAEAKQAVSKFYSCTSRAGWLADDYTNIVNRANRYARKFSLTLPPLFGLELSGPKAKEKLAKAKQAQKDYEAALEAARQQAVKLSTEYEQKWINGEKVNRWHYFKIGKFQMPITFSQARIRFLPDTNEVETSQGAKVSIKAAKILWQRIQDGKSVKGHKINGYTVIGYNGELKIGCHIIKQDEIDRFAAVVGW